MAMPHHQSSIQKSAELPRKADGSVRPIHEWEQRVRTARQMFARTLERWAWDVLALRKDDRLNIRWHGDDEDACPHEPDSISF